MKINYITLVKSRWASKLGMEQQRKIVNKDWSLFSIYLISFQHILSEGYVDLNRKCAMKLFCRNSAKIVNGF